MSLPSAVFGEHYYGTFAVEQKRRFQLVSLDRLPKLIEAFLGVNSEEAALFPESARC